jgi:magnesium-transporting ATPase (P-type)
MDLTPGIRKRLDDASEYVYAALIIILSIIAMTIFLWLMYDHRSLATTAEQMALMNALFVSDTTSLVVASAAVALCLYLSSLRFGDLRNQFRLETFAVIFIIMLAPIIFIGADILLQP